MVTSIAVAVVHELICMYGHWPTAVAPASASAPAAALAEEGHKSNTQRKFGSRQSEACIKY